MEIFSIPAFKSSVSACDAPQIHRTMSDPAPTYSVTGGARIGFVNYSWPMATLNATADRLTIATSLFGLLGMGTYSFGKDQVLSMESCGWLPVLGQGVRIHHTVAGYPAKMIFWGNPQKTLAGIAAVGFVPAPAHAGILQQRPNPGFPLRWLPLLVLAIIWNGLFLLAGNGPSAAFDPGLPVVLALGLFFAVSMTALRSPAVQKIFLKPGRHFGEVRNAFVLTACITGFMAVIFGVLAIGSALVGPKDAKPVTPPVKSIR